MTELQENQGEFTTDSLIQAGADLYQASLTIQNEDAQAAQFIAMVGSAAEEIGRVFKKAPDGSNVSKMMKWSKKLSETLHLFKHILTGELQIVPSALPENASELITAEINSKKIECGDFAEIEFSSEIVNRGKQQFGVFGTVAYELLDQAIYANWHQMIAKPALSDGQAVVFIPEEGSVKILTWVQLKSEWFLDWRSTSRLYSDELSLSAEQVGKNIARDIESGILVIG